MKQFTSSSKTIEACNTAEVTVTISVPSGYKFLDVCNVSSNGGVCPGYLGWRNGNTLHLFIAYVFLFCDAELNQKVNDQISKKMYCKEKKDDQNNSN